MKLIELYVQLFNKIWNDIQYLRLFFVIDIVIIFFLIIIFIMLKLKIKLINYLKTRISEIIFGNKKTFSDLCSDIFCILSENKRVFDNFAVNSNINSNANPFERSLPLWDNVKKNIIVPNNKKIVDLIDDNFSLIPEDKKEIFNKFKNHSIAFSAHVYDNTIDYGNFQFPSDFESTIYSQIINNNEIEQVNISEWLKNEFDSIRFVTTRKFWLFGSILKNKFDRINDVDILFYDPYLSKEDLSKKENISNLEILKKSFKKKFKKELHLIIFCKKELESFNCFLSKIDVKVER